MDAIDLLARYAGTDSDQKLYAAGEKVPIDGVIPKAWLDGVIDDDGRVERIPYELCVLIAPREALHRREVYVQGAGRWKDPDENLPGDFEDNRDVPLRRPGHAAGRRSDPPTALTTVLWSGWPGGSIRYNDPMPRRLDREAAASFMIEHGLEPLEQYPGAGKQWRCRCLACGDEVRPRYANIKQGWGGCSRCGRLAQSRTRRGSEEKAIADFRAVGLEPLEPYASVMTPWRSQCRRCGRVVSPLLNNIRKGQGACEYCSGKRVDTKAAAAVMRAASLEPLVAYPGRHAPWPCRCLRCGQSVSPSYGAVRAGGGCRHCNDTAIKPDAAAAAMRNAKLEPLEPYPGSLARWRCRCLKCNKIVSPCYSTIPRGSGGCRWCRNSGFKAADNAVVYLITHAAFRAAKIGITDSSGSRLKKHIIRGWQVLCTVAVPGERAMLIEAEILDWWRGELALPAYLGQREMKQGGWTETVSAEEIDLAVTIRRIRHLAEGPDHAETLTSLLGSRVSAAEDVTGGPTDAADRSPRPEIIRGNGPLSLIDRM